MNDIELVEDCIEYDPDSGRTTNNNLNKLTNSIIYCKDERYDRQIPIRIIYKSKNLIITDKPYDLRVDGSTDTSPTLQSELELKLKDKKISFTNNIHDEKNVLHMLHQIDYGTSGVHMFGRDKKTASEFGKMFVSRKISKCYVALVKGHLNIDKNSQILNCTCKHCGGESDFEFDLSFDKPGEDFFKIGKKNGEVILLDYEFKRKAQSINPYDNMIGLSHNDEHFNVLTIDEDISQSLTDDRHSIVYSDKLQDPNGILNRTRKSSQTSIIPLNLGFFHNLPCTRVLAFPHTGRKHQIRVHLAHIGFPILGDHVYTKANILDREKNVLHESIPYRMMLHSLRTEIPIQAEVNKDAIDTFNVSSNIIIPTNKPVYYFPRNNERYGIVNTELKETIKMIIASIDDPEITLDKPITIDICRLNKRIRKKLTEQKRLILNKLEGHMTILPSYNKVESSENQMRAYKGILSVVARDPFFNYISKVPKINNCAAKDKFLINKCQSCTCSIYDFELFSNKISCDCKCIPFGRRKLL